MRIERFETLACDGGWRTYHFLKLVTDTGVVGWSEFDEGFGPPGLATVIGRYAEWLTGRDVHDHEAIRGTLAATARPAPDGLSGEALGAIENALLDAKAKALGVPVYDLLGGRHRDTVPVYWSHCASWRINHPDHYAPAITDLDGVRRAGADAREQGFPALKTNLFRYEGGRPHRWMPGFGAPPAPGMNVEPPLIRDVLMHLEALRDGAGPDVELMLDINFNARTEGFLRLIRALDDVPLLWIELDVHNPEALATIRRHSRHPIASLETLFGVRGFLPHLRAQAVDVAIVDAVWNGVWQAMRIAGTAEAFDVNIAPHNFYSHLATFMNVHFAAATPNLRIMETDVDRLAWDDELFTHVPEIAGGAMTVPDRPGWGTEPDEEALRAHPPRPGGAYLGL
jgi:galactonate dehydratase